MTITYSWQLTSLKKTQANNLDHVVVQTYWKKIGTNENGVTGEFSGATPFNPGLIDPNNFTEFSALTEAQVLSWIQGQVTGSYEEHVNSRIAEQIQAKVTPIEDVSGNSFPWAQVQQ